MKLKSVQLLSSFSLKFNLRRYILAGMDRRAQCGATQYGALHQREGPVSSPAVCSPDQIHH